MPYQFKIARDPREIAQIQALTYRTFVEEIPQHPANDGRRLVDRFHDENVYIVGLCDERLVAMMALRGRRPFSLDGKLPDLDRYLPPGRSVCEVRLLAIEQEHRKSALLGGLLEALWRHAEEEGFDAAVISGTTRQLALYEHMGFVPFGPLVGNPDASFQPMLITRERFERNALSRRRGPESFLTGPGRIHADVAAALASNAESHRCEAFLESLHAVKRGLAALTGARHVDVLLGSGTTANDAVAAQLSLVGGRGVILSNGEFGERLVDHATRAGLTFDVVRSEWGAPLREAPAADWIWLVACETSSGVMNDLAAVRRAGGIVCVDAVSAIGAVPLDLTTVDFATASSGKALGAYPGLALVLRNREVTPSPSLPRSLDLGLYARDVVPFTHSSNLVHALRTAIDLVDWRLRHEQIAATGHWLRRHLVAIGFTLAGTATPAPHVITMQVDDSRALGESLEAAGYHLGWRSSYLRERNWIQIGLMGELTRRDVIPLLRALRRGKDEMNGGRASSPAAVGHPARR